MLGFDLEVGDIGFVLSFALCVWPCSGLYGAVAAYMANLHYDFTHSLCNVLDPSAQLGATVFAVSV